MRTITLTFACIFSLLATTTIQARKFQIRQGETISIRIDKGDKPVVSTALDMLKSDFAKVLKSDVRETTDAESAQIIAGFDESLSSQEFMLEVRKDGRLHIHGGDAHGLAYGLLEVSRLIGVSPWEWWADSSPRLLYRFSLKSGFASHQKPSVDYRGIFINDEDWGLMPWANNYEGLGRGIIGPQTNARIFELMLRLRANYYWPAMHECTHPFFLTEGNREIAARYGIYIGGSHCEPMASSTAVEWGLRGKGQYDYVNNATGVRDFWESRVKDVANQEIVYTLGMRGVHDGKMQGAKTIDEQKAVLQRVINDQRNMLRQHVNPNIESIPQVFIPYKEVLDIYNAGLEVPDDVTLMWCDDNYGFIRHFPTPAERERKGGNGIYYHVSYWGRPHDYLWLCTISPHILHQQMSLAYERGIRKMWILNVGDIKPAEYHTELFMDMAWNIDHVNTIGVERHMHNFYSREFGHDNADHILPIMQEHYRLASIRRPEFMAGTRTEESDRKYWSTQRQLPWSEAYKAERLDHYRTISDKAEQLVRHIPYDRQDTYLQLVKYPVQGAAQMNFKYLCKLQESAYAHDSIVALTHTYNRGITNFGKWYGIMDMRPRRLPVFNPVTGPLAPSNSPLQLLQGGGTNYELGIRNYEGTGGNHNSEFIIHNYEPSQGASITFEIRLLPTHPVEGDKLSFKLTLDGTDSPEVEYQTRGRSEEWKQNILRGYALRRVTLPLSKKKGKHRLTFTPLTPGVVLQEIRMVTEDNL